MKVCELLAQAAQDHQRLTALGLTSAADDASMPAIAAIANRLMDFRSSTVTAATLTNVIFGMHGRVDLVVRWKIRAPVWIDPDDGKRASKIKVQQSLQRITVLSVYPPDFSRVVSALRDIESEASVPGLTEILNYINQILIDRILDQILAGPTPSEGGSPCAFVK